MVRPAQWAMPNEGIEGDEWGAYVVLARFAVTEHGMAYRARARGSRSANSTRGVTSHQGARESRAQGEVAQVVGCPGAVRYARCGTPKQEWALCERCSQEATGELLEIERLMSSLGRGHWKSTHEGNSLVAYSTVRPVFNGGHEETYGNATRLVPTQLIDARVQVAHPRPIAARRVGIETTGG